MSWGGAPWGEHRWWERREARTGDFRGDMVSGYDLVSGYTLGRKGLRWSVFLVC